MSKIGKIMEISIRKETPNDYPDVYAVNKQAFEEEEEAKLVEMLRHSSAFVPELSLVATIDNNVVGHILFTKIKIIDKDKNEYESLALAPMAVKSEFQKITFMKTKTILFSLIFSLTIFFCSNIIGQRNDLEKLNLNDNIKSIREFSYQAFEKFGDIQKGKTGFSYYNIYNRMGNKVEDNRYNPNGDLEKLYIYKYNNNGNRIEQIQFLSDSSIIRKITYKHDKKGNIIEDNSYTIEGKLDKTYTFKYDDKGNVIEDNSYTSDRILIKTFTYKYDENNYKIENSRFASDGNLEKKHTYKYNSKGNVIENNCYTYDGSLLRKYSYNYKYDINDNWIKKIEYENEIPKYIIEREIEYYK